MFFFVFFQKRTKSCFFQKNKKKFFLNPKKQNPQKNRWVAFFEKNGFFYFFSTLVIPLKSLKGYKIYIAWNFDLKLGDISLHP